MEENKNGRPTSYRSEYNEQARKLCLLGYTDKQLADFFGVCEATINNWKIEKDGFLESLSYGKDIADAEVAKSLYERATGYHDDANDIHLPPDATSMIFWLKNRQSKKWRDKQEVEQSGEISINITGSDASL